MLRKCCALYAFGICVFVSGCISFPSRTELNKVSQAELSNSEATQIVANKQAIRMVQAVRLDAESTEGETSWQIEPAITWVPNTLVDQKEVPTHIQRRLQYAFDLAQRGAIYSANTEFRSVLGLCALELDAKQNSERHRTALCAGFTALEEADDFVKNGNELDSKLNVREIVASHRTTVLKQNSLEGIHSVVAIRAYYEYAQHQLLQACAEMPYATTAFYGLGRTSKLRGADVSLATARAMLFHRTAFALDPTNTLAGNELGVLLAQHGQLQDAELVLRNSANLGKSQEAWRNLAVVCTRLGNEQASQFAWKQSKAVARQASGGSPTVPVQAAEPVLVASATEKAKLNDSIRPTEEVALASPPPEKPRKRSRRGSKLRPGSSSSHSKTKRL